jgi:hypothetical protein
LSDGNVGSPSLNFSSESNTGIYRAASGQFNVSVLGSNILTIAATGITVTGTGTFSGGISGGVF